MFNIDSKTCKSYFNSIDIGIYERSVLGPILFNIFKNDKHVVFKSYNVILFADNINIICKDKDLYQHRC